MEKRTSIEALRSPPGRNALGTNQRAVRGASVAAGCAFGDAKEAQIRQVSEVETASRELQKRFLQFGEATSDVWWLRDVQSLRGEYVSPAFETVFGKPIQDVRCGNNFKEWLCLVLPADRRGVIEAIRRVRKGESVNHDFRIRRPVDGQIRWIRSTDFPVLDDDGRIERIGGIGQDITAFKVTIADLDHSVRLFRQFADNSTNALWIADAATRRVDYASFALKTIWGGGTGDAFATLDQWATTVHAEDLAPIEAALKAVVAGETRQYEYRIIRRNDGAMRWLREVSFPIRDGGDEVVKIGRVTEDLTRQEGVQVYVAGGAKADASHLSASLRRGGYRVRQFASVTELTETAGVLAPGVILLDTRRTERTAAAIVREIRGRSPEMRVIVVADKSAATPTVVAAMKAGAVDCLQAPVMAEALSRPILEAASSFNKNATTSSSHDPGAATRLECLSVREREVLQGLVGGGTSKTIALELGISPRTIEQYRARLMERLNVATLAELLHVAILAGVTPPNGRPERLGPCAASSA